MGPESIRFDFNNMMGPALGRGRGLKVSDINTLKKRTQEIHLRIQGMREARSTPFYDVIFEEKKLEPILAMGNRVRERYENLVVLGVGGSALGAKALHVALNHPLHNSIPREERSGVRLFVADNIDPVAFEKLLDHLEPSKTLFNVISRSGETAETLAQFLVAREHTIRAVGDRQYKNHFLLTTGAAGPLHEIAMEEGFLSFPLPAGIVGRYSVFSAVGLLPVAASGTDVRSFLAGARDMADRCRSPDLWGNPAYIAGVLHYLAHKKRGKKIRVVMPYSDLLTGVAEWFCQLWAESLGKERNLQGKVVNAGTSPVRALGITDQHSQLQLYMEGPDDKVIDFIRVEKFPETVPIPRAYEEREDLACLGGRELSELLLAEQAATEMALSKNGRMNSTIILGGITPYTIGQLLFMWEIQTVFAAGLYGVDPFNQPGVEEGKRLVYGMLGRRGYQKERREAAARRGKKKKGFVL